MISEPELGVEFESGSGLEQARKLRYAQIATQWVDHKWWLGVHGGWKVGWPWAKTTAMEAEREVQQFGVSWVEAWARAEARAWAEVKTTHLLVT